MTKRVFAMLLCLSLMLGMVPAASAVTNREPIEYSSVDQCTHTLRVDPLDPNYVRPAYDGYLIEITPQRVEDTFAYLDEHYVKNYPEQALMVYTGTEEDQANLLKLAETITAGCTNDREKADAIGRWLSGNITYDVNTSAYASDTFYRREGNCLSYANLMMFLLRSLGIPAVVGDGWRGDMKTSTVDLFNMEGHAWIFVLLEGQWVLYDPLWIDGGTTDRDYMAKNIYFDTVEFVTPATDGNNLPPKTSEVPMPFWTNGQYYLYSNAFPSGSGTLSYFVNNQAYIFVTNQCEPEGSQDGRYYYDGRNKSDMVMGELYRDGWVSYGDYHKGESMAHAYAFPNGMMPDGYAMEFDGKLWYMSYDAAMPILMDEGDYWIQDGLVTVKPGFSGPCLGLRWQDGCFESSYGEVFLTCENRNPEVATMDDDGNVTAHAEGYAAFRLTLQRRERNGDVTLMGSATTQIFVSTEDRTPDYRDLSLHEHSIVYSHSIEPTCDEWGIDIYRCTVCGYTEERYGADPLGHDHVAVDTIDPTCTEYGYVIYECARCGNRYQAAEIDMLGHDWEGTECTRCDATRLTPFDDVTIGDYYEVPVAWAVANGITNGMNEAEFAPGMNCIRAQVVTFLWRAADKPAPEMTEHPFEDVTVDYYYDAMLWAVEKGITNGMSATTFEPGTTCTRGQVVTFLWRAAGSPEPGITEHPFDDVNESNYYYKAVLWAMENGVTQGMTDKTFEPERICTRAQVVTFLYRAFGD